MDNLVQRLLNLWQTLFWSLFQIRFYEGLQKTHLTFLFACFSQISLRLLSGRSQVQTWWRNALSPYLRVTDHLCPLSLTFSLVITVSWPHWSLLSCLTVCWGSRPLTSLLSSLFSVSLTVSRPRSRLSPLLSRAWLTTNWWLRTQRTESSAGSSPTHRPAHTTGHTGPEIWSTEMWRPRHLSHVGPFNVLSIPPLISAHDFF